MSEKIWTLSDIISAMQARGSHWFDKSTMRFFNSSLSEKIYQGPGGIYFVTGERMRYEDSSERRYTVRRFDPEAIDIDTVGPFCRYSASTAHHLAAEYAKTAPISSAS